MSIQTINTPNGLGYGTQPTRYVISPAQKSFLHKLKDWVITNPNSVSSDPLEVVKYTSLVIRVLSTNGYDEEDRFLINHIRYLYLKDKDTLPF